MLDGVNSVVIKVIFKSLVVEIDGLSKDDAVISSTIDSCKSIEYSASTIPLSSVILFPLTMLP